MASDETVSDTATELARHILAQRWIRRRVVVLCEGDLLPPRPPDRARSPGWYRGLDRLPDASFYSKCVPRHWRTSGLREPRFINCGGRGNVLATFARALELHRAAPQDSYLSPHRLFALVDLDLQSARLETSSLAADTEALWQMLYHQDAAASPDERIWVTALIHREAYFLCADTAQVLEAHSPAPRFDERPWTVDAVRDAGLAAVRQEGPCPDRGLAAHADIAARRLALLGVTSDPDTASLARSLSAIRATDEALFERGLWSVTKAKPHWERVTPTPDEHGSQTASQYRDNLTLSMAAHIATLAPNAHPVARFFRWLEQHAM